MWPGAMAAVALPSYTLLTAPASVGVTAGATRCRKPSPLPRTVELP
jgi:hypothetical protein